VPEETSGPPVTDRLTDALDAGLRVGATLARRLADATGSTPLEGDSSAPIDDIVRYGSQAAGNVIGLVVSGARSGLDAGTRVGRATGATGRDSRSAGPAAPAGPVVTAGSTLRVPLLVENGGQTPTRALTFTTASLVRAGCEDGPGCTCIGTDAVTFDPPTLVVAAHDFEKLTVRVAVPADAVADEYVAEIVAGEGWFSTALRWSVVAPR
jgi:hypothetical protein